MKAWLAIGAVIGASAVHAQGPTNYSPAPAREGVWEYCPSSGVYYPWVESCATQWESMPSDPGVDLPPTPPPPTWILQRGRVGDQIWQSGLRAAAQRYKNEIQNDKDRQAAQVRQSALNAEMAATKAKDEKNGIRHINLSDLSLDKGIIPDKTILVVRGIYQPVGDSEWLMTVPDQDNMPEIPLITAGAPRDTRAALQRCRMSMFCSITLVGHLGSCAHTYLGKPFKADRCLYVIGRR